MKWAAAALALAAISGCRPTYHEPEPSPVSLPPLPPERVLRKPPDFRFKDYTNGKTYFYRGFSESMPEGGEFRLEIVTVRDADADVERDANPEEREYALRVLEEDWLKKGMTEQIEYHRELARIGRERRDTLIEARIEYAEKAAAHIEEELTVLKADLEASTKTTGYRAPAGHVEFLQREVAAKQSALAEERAKLEMLRYALADRDRAYGRSSRVPPKS